MRRWATLVVALVCVIATGSGAYAQAPSDTGDKMGKDKMMDKDKMDKDKMMDKKQ
jgi:pentapeptide MXKDX repeat protein